MLPTVEETEQLKYLTENVRKLSEADQVRLRQLLHQQDRGCRTNKWMDMVRPSLHPKQKLFLSLEHREVMFGGAAGGSKSDSLLLSMMQYLDVPGYSSIIFRRTFKDLSGPGSIMDRAKSWFNPLKEHGVQWSANDNSFYFPTGPKSQPSRYAFAYLQHDDDKRNYQGWELHACAFDELTQHPRSSYSYLFSRLRRLKGSGIPIRMRSACVPYGNVLTVAKGWQDIRTVKAGDVVYSVNKLGVLEEKEVLEFYETQFTGDLVRIDKKNLRMIMTPDHRVVFNRFGKTEHSIEPWNSIPNKSIEIVRTPVDWIGGPGYSGDTHGMPVDDYLAFMGIYLAEGSVNHTVRKGNYKVIVTQGKLRAYGKVKELLDRTPWNWCWSKNGDFQCCSKSLRAYLIQFGKSHCKFVPREILQTCTKAQLELFFKWICLGDGHDRMNTMTYVTTSPLLADNVQEIGVKLGFKVTVNCQVSTNPNHHDRFNIYITNESTNRTKVDRNDKRNDVTHVAHDGPVYCIKVADNENFILRQEGTIWCSGNTNPGGKYGDWVKDDFIPQEYLDLADNPDAQFAKMWEKRTPCDECRSSGLFEGAVCLYCEGMTYRTRLFVPSRIQDNPSIDMAEYRRSLINLPFVERYRLENGDWSISEQGDLFKEQWARYYSRNGDHFVLHRPDLPDLLCEIGSLVFFITADTASKEKTTNDFTCIATWAFHQQSNSLILIHVLMERMEVPKIADAIINQSAAAKSSFAIIESAQCGIGVIQELNGPKGKGMSVLDYNPHTGDKVARSTTAQVRMESGGMYFPFGRPGWLSAPFAQLLGFNESPHDDFVDNASMASWWCHSRHQTTNSAMPIILKRLGA